MTQGRKPVSSGGLLRLSDADNVLVATGPVGPSMAAINGGGQITLVEAVTLGHKVACREPVYQGEDICCHAERDDD